MVWDCIQCCWLSRILHKSLERSSAHFVDIAYLPQTPQKIASNDIYERFHNMDTTFKLPHAMICAYTVSILTLVMINSQVMTIVFLDYCQTSLDCGSHWLWSCWLNISSVKDDSKLEATWTWLLSCDCICCMWVKLKSAAKRALKLYARLALIKLQWCIRANQIKILRYFTNDKQGTSQIVEFS